MERCTDKEKREELVKKVKEKILKEIENYEIKIKKNLLNIANKEINDETKQDWEYLIEKSFYLLRLKEYINEVGTFMRYEKLDYKNDVAIYQINIEYLNIWLEKDFYFVSNFLFAIEDGLNIYTALDDRYFGYEFTDAFSVIKYREKQEKQNNDTI